MKVAVYYNLQYGGAKRAVFEHVKGLKALGHVVDVYTQDEEMDDFNPGVIANNHFIYPFRIKTIHVPVFARIYKDFQHFFILKNLHKKIARAIDEKKYDIVLTHTDFYTQAPFILRFLKTKSVYYCLEPLRMVYEYSLRMPKNLGLFNKLYETINRLIRKNIDRTNARAANFFLALSYFTRDYMIQVYDVYGKVSYLGVNTELFRPKNVKKKNQVLFVAPKEYIFGYDLIQKALKLIPKEKRPELKIVFGLKKSQRLTEEEVVKAYNESFVTVSLSKHDTFGLVPLESMACETPVIALNVAGYRELVKDKKTGFLIEVDPQMLADMIMKVKNEPKLAQTMGKEGRKYIQAEWTWEKIIKNLEIQLQTFIKK